MIGNKKSQKGFSLVELITAVAIFSTFSLIASGVFISAIKLNRRALNIQRADENARNILEIMFREIRVADTISGSDTPCPSSWVSTLTFTHPVSGQIRYFLSNDQLHREVKGNDSVISSKDVRIKGLRFCLLGLGQDDLKQARVLIQLTVEAGQGNETTTNQIQTTISQRRVIDD